MTATSTRRALKALFNTYWTSAGWRDSANRVTPRDEFEFATRAGVMFDPIRVSHDDVVDRALAAVKRVDRRSVADAFIVSLAARRLELRSALGSYAVFQHVARHSAAGTRKPCPECGAYGGKPEKEDLNVLNFERFKWGGVRHDQPLYASLDLELFDKLPRVTATAENVAVFKCILRAIDAAPMHVTSATLERHLSKAFRSNKAERDTVIAILGFCGILATPEHPGYTNGFVPWSERELPDRRFVDMAYPACWWQRSHGVNQPALAYWFGHVL